MISDDASRSEPVLSIETVHADRTLDADLIGRVVDLVVAAEKGELASLGVVLADHATVRALNKEYLDHDDTTDVLAFLYSDTGEPLDGEIFVDLDTAAERHTEFNTTFEAEACRYIIHGLLHLLGYRDSTEAGKGEMGELEDRYLQFIDPL